MTDSTKTPIKIDMFADIVCPWCYMGRRDVAAAANLHGGVALRLHWRGYLLNRRGSARRVVLTHDDPATAAKQMRIIAAGRGMEIAFNPATLTRPTDSRAAQALIIMAQEQTGAPPDALIESLFAAHFIKGRNIGDAAVLGSIAAEHGLAFTPPLMAAAMSRLAGDMEEAARIGVTALPFYVFPPEMTLSGSHAPKNFLPLFDATIAASAIGVTRKRGDFPQ